MCIKYTLLSLLATALLGCTSSEELTEPDLDPGQYAGFMKEGTLGKIFELLDDRSVLALSFDFKIEQELADIEACVDLRVLATIPVIGSEMISADECLIVESIAVVEGAWIWKGEIEDRKVVVAGQFLDEWDSVAVSIDIAKIYHLGDFELDRVMRDTAASE